MSVTDTITVEWDEKREKYYLLQGRETFYDDDGVWIQFNTKEEAEEYKEAIRKAVLANTGDG